MVTRAQIQTKIDSIMSDPLVLDKSLSSLQVLMGSWLDTFDLSQDSLSHDYIKSHILDDLNSYKGVTQ